MSTLFRFSADFIDKLSNPSHGPLINEEYSLKLAQLMEDEGFENLFTREVKLLKETDELSSYGWIWLLRWCRKNEVKPGDELLTALMHRWSDVFLQSLVIDAATFNSENKYSSQWLSNIIREVTGKTKPGQRPSPLDIFGSVKSSSESSSPPLRIQPAENLLLALLHLETNIAIEGARELLQSEWTGQQALLNYFWARVGLLDEDSGEKWISMLEPPERYEQ